MEGFSVHSRCSSRVTISRGWQFHFGQRIEVGLGHARLKIGVVAAYDRFEALHRYMNIAVGTDAIELDEETVHLVVGAAQHLRYVSEILPVRADDIGVEKLCLAEAERRREGAGDRSAGLGGTFHPVLGSFLLAVASSEKKCGAGTEDEDAHVLSFQQRIELRFYAAELEIVMI